MPIPSFTYIQITDALKTAVNSYLRTCSSGGMPHTTEQQIRGAMTDMVDYGYLASALTLAPPDETARKAALYDHMLEVCKAHGYNSITEAITATKRT